MAEKKEAKKQTKKKRVGPDDIPGWDTMTPMERGRAIALANSVEEEGVVIPASDFDINLKFLKVPDLYFQWALSRPGYAMGRIESLMGYEGSSKTSFQFWLANLALSQGGMAEAVFVEHADSSYHIGQYVRPEFMPYFICHKCDTLEQAIRKSYEIQDNWAVVDPLGLVPKVQIFDSIAGATQEKLLEEDYEPGAPKPGGIGGIMSDFVNAMQTRISRTNSLWAVNNQAKDQIPVGWTGAPMPEIEKMVAKGGRALPFHSTYQQIVKKMGAIKVADGAALSGKSVEGFKAKMTFKKNKLGVPMREIFYDVVWGEGFVFRDHTLDFLVAGKFLGLSEKKAGNKGILYFSKELGIKDTAALSADEIYAAIHSDELMPKFQRELGVIIDVATSSGRGAVPAGMTPPAPPP